MCKAEICQKLKNRLADIKESVDCYLYDIDSVCCDEDVEPLIMSEMSLFEEIAEAASYYAEQVAEVMSARYVKPSEEDNYD